ncbi:kinase-like protein [Pleomassaria siparia CBS 279.74]|uniref:Kinase-like protein n=1 Tax=Pleomassaria siparia CBS 279.74 TaxID=1314801 RepID=A0A6G1K635_9PLEO|nr:kinase-like protein [Pleomassaria siparia CBS 279.74]
MAPSISDSDRRRLHAIFDDYELFWSYGFQHLIWNDLSQLLMDHLSRYFQSRYIFYLPKSTPRTQYLGRCTPKQIGHIANDVLYVWLRDTGLFPAISKNNSRNLEQAYTRRYISELTNHDLHLLLVDITIELDKIRARLRGVIGHFTDTWNPSVGSETGIIDYLYSPSVRISRSRRLLQRALNIGARNRDRVNENLTAGNNDTQSKPAVATKSTSWNRFDDRPRRPASISANLLNTSKMKQPLQLLEAIIEEAEETGLSESPYQFYIGSYLTVGSEPSIEDLDSLLELQAQTSKSTHSSTTTLSRQSSFDVGELLDLERVRSSEHETTSSNDQSSLHSTAKASMNSTLSGHYSFVTAKSQFSLVEHRSRVSSMGYSIDSFMSAKSLTSLHPTQDNHDSYYNILKEQNLIPDAMVETDWSGRGQHIKYAASEWSQIPLQVEKVLGETRTAMVESVRCKRVRLVRKTIRCTKWTGLRREDVIKEVQHLYRVQHSHVVRLVGTYVIGVDIAILTYPCAEWNLEAFMQTTYTAEDRLERSTSLQQFFTCLANLFDFMHSLPLKHMDVKPQNLLVRNSKGQGLGPYKIYLTDFGISRAYTSVEESETETPTSFTRTYAAREVVLQESRGLSADMFSLGCVYAELLAVILDNSVTGNDMSEPSPRVHWDSLLLARGRNGDGMRPYHSATDEIKTWLSDLLPIEEAELCSVRNWTTKMLDMEPNNRPSARQIAEDPKLPFPCLGCTLRTGPEEFEAAEPPSLPTAVPGTVGITPSVIYTVSERDMIVPSY